MKKYFSTFTLVLAAVIAGLLQLGCASPQPTNTSTNANVAVAEATQDISGEYRSVDTFVRRNEQWQLIGSATVPVPKTASPTAMSSPTPRASSSMKPSPTAKPSPAMKTMSPPPPAKTP